MESEINSSGDHRSLFIDWVRTHIPEEFHRDTFDKITGDLKAFEGNREKIQQYFSDPDVSIVMSATQTPEEAIQEAHIALYLAEAFDGNQITRKAIIRSLLMLSTPIFTQLPHDLVETVNIQL